MEMGVALRKGGRGEGLPEIGKHKSGGVMNAYRGAMLIEQQSSLDSTGPGSMLCQSAIEKPMPTVESTLDGLRLEAGIAASHRVARFCTALVPSDNHP
jgi:hypothetical protein